MNDDRQICRCSSIVEALNEPSTGLHFDGVLFWMGSACIIYCPFCGALLPNNREVRIPTLNKETKQRLTEQVEHCDTRAEVIQNFGRPRQVNPNIAYHTEQGYKSAEGWLYRPVCSAYCVEFWVDGESVVYRNVEALPISVTMRESE